MATCSSGKKVFTKREARGAANRIYENKRNGRQMRQRRHRPDHLRIYHCPLCNFYHLSSH